MQMNTKTSIAGLKEVVDGLAVEQAIDAARSCDLAHELLTRDQYEIALETSLYVIQSQAPGFVLRARDIALDSIDKLIDDAYHRKNFVEVLQYIDQWLSLKPDDLYALILKGEILHLEMDDFNSATQVFRYIVKRYPHCIEAWIYLSNIELYKRHYGRAMYYLVRAWKALKGAQWAYLPTDRVIINIIESLYDSTARILSIAGDKEDAKSVILDGIRRIGHESDYLQYRLEKLNRHLDVGAGGAW